MSIIGKWIQKTYQTILSEYKLVLNQWYKGTGGGSGDYNMFEDWSQEKMDKYDVSMIYDHTIIADRPPILIDGYAKKRKYITIMFLLDSKKDLLLASKYDPVKIGMGEAGVGREDDSSNIYASQKSVNSKVSSITTKTTPEEDAQIMVKTVLNLVMDKEREANSKPKENLTIESQSLSELMQLVDMYMKNLEYRRGRGTLSPEREEKINTQMDYIMEIIEDRQSNKKRCCDDNDGMKNN